MNTRHRFAVLAAIAFLLFAGAIALRASGYLSMAEWTSESGQLLLPVVLIAALIDSINPCAFSVLLLTIAFLFGMGRLRSDILRIGGVYIFGIFLVYVFIGVGILQVLSILSIPRFMSKLGALVLVAAGILSLLDHYFPAFPIRLRIPRASHRKIGELMHKASLPTAFLLGGFVGLTEFPCTGGPYLLVLGLLHDNSTFLLGLSYLALYNLIFVLPLVVLLFLASHPEFLERVREWERAGRGRTRWMGGLLMVFLGFLILML